MCIFKQLLLFISLFGNPNIFEPFAVYGIFFRMPGNLTLTGIHLQGCWAHKHWNITFKICFLPKAVRGWRRVEEELRVSVDKPNKH